MSPRHNEQKIACLLDAVDLDRCETTARHTSRLTCCWLVTSKQLTHQSRAFSVMTELSTHKKYRLIWKRFIAFIIMRACFYGSIGYGIGWISLEASGRQTTRTIQDQYQKAACRRWIR